MNSNLLSTTTVRRAAFRLLVISIALCICSAVSAQKGKRILPPPRLMPDLVISSLKARLVNQNNVEYSWTITNVGAIAANLDGPTTANADNVSVQAYLSQDTVWSNSGDVPAGGTILGLSPLGNLAPHASKSGSFTATFQGNIESVSYLVLKVDVGNVVYEGNENNNTAAVGVAR